MTAAHDILTKAAGHMQDRAATYDKPEGERSMAQAVAIFNLYHGAELTEAQGWHLLQILKDVRLFTRPGYHADSAEDCVAYAALKAEALAGSAGIPADLEPAVLANVAAFNGDWPDETRRQDVDDVTIWPPEGHVDTEAFRRRIAVGADVAFPEERGLYFAATPGELEDGA